MRRYLQLIFWASVGVLFLQACGASQKLSEGKATDKIRELGFLQSQGKDLKVQKIIQSGSDQAVAEVTLQLAFRLSRGKGQDWGVSAIRLGDRDWIDAATFLTMLNEIRTRQTRESLERLQEGIRNYHQKTGVYPPATNIVKLTDLVFPNYMAELIRDDAWNRPLAVKSREDHSVEITSSGPDGILGNSDDIILSSSISP
jgi:hypothetical protein